MYVSYWLDIASGATIVLLQAAFFLAALAGVAIFRRPRSAGARAAVASPDPSGHDAI
jgi:hypothetical protein